MDTATSIEEILNNVVDYPSIADLILEYIDRHQEKLPIHEIALSVFHAGQLYAIGKDINRAVGQFQRSYDLYPLGVGKEYILATIAFLQGDKFTLDTIADETDPSVINRDVIQRLRSGYGKSYVEAYSDINEV